MGGEGALYIATVPQRPGEPLRWRHLNVEERKLIANGCGGKGSWLKPPVWLFLASCDVHDFNYWLGHTEEDRKKADRQFYEMMLKDVERTPWWYPKFMARWRAWLYYKGVRRYARDYFYFADAEKTRADLDRELEEKRRAAA